MLVDAPLVLLSVDGLVGTSHVGFGRHGLVLDLVLHVLAVLHQEHAGVTRVKTVVAGLKDLHLSSGRSFD